MQERRDANDERYFRALIRIPEVLSSRYFHSLFGLDNDTASAVSSIAVGIQRVRTIRVHVFIEVILVRYYGSLLR